MLQMFFSWVVASTTKGFFISPPIIVQLRAQIGDNIIHHLTVTDFQVKSYLVTNEEGAYNLGLVMGQHVDVIEIYWRYRYYHAFPGPTTTRCCFLVCAHFHEY